jgi:phosphoribosylformylglycinamidine (FGAM) synthase-like enzyme
MIAMVECLRNLVCAGATPLAMTDNLNFGNPYKPENFYQLKECVAGLAEACRFFDVPVVGGNVSLYNESPEGRDRPDADRLGGRVHREEAHITRQFAGSPGGRLVLLGGAPSELGGSQFLGIIHGMKTGDAPAVDLAAEKAPSGFPPRADPAGRVGGARPERGRPPRGGLRDAFRPREPLGRNSTSRDFRRRGASTRSSSARARGAW